MRSDKLIVPKGDDQMLVGDEVYFVADSQHVKRSMSVFGHEEKEARRLLEILVKKKAVHAYPILVEGNGQRVTQAEHTFIPNETGVTITTIQ